MKLEKTDLPRREFIRERLFPGVADFLEAGSEALNVVSSLILQVRPELRQSVCSAITRVPNAEIHADDGNCKVVVLMETASDAELSDFMSMAADIPGVINVCMVYHHTDVSKKLFSAE